MTEHLVTPERHIRIGEKPFTLDSTFGTLKAVQHAFQQDLLVVQARILDMRQDEIAKLIALASGSNEDAIGQLILDEIDLLGKEYMLLKGELLSWIVVAMTPRKDREKKALAMEEAIRKSASGSSRGGSTESGVSASSGGRRKRSGKAPSGT